MLDCTGSPMVFAGTLVATCCWSGGAVEIAWSGTCYLWDPCVECEGRRGVEEAVAKGCQCGRGRECTHVARTDCTPYYASALTNQQLPSRKRQFRRANPARCSGFSARRFSQLQVTDQRNDSPQRQTGVSEPAAQGLTRMRWHDRDKLPRALFAGMSWRDTLVLRLSRSGQWPPDRPSRAIVVRSTCSGQI